MFSTNEMALLFEDQEKRTNYKLNIIVWILFKSILFSKKNFFSYTKNIMHSFSIKNSNEFGEKRQKTAQYCLIVWEYLLYYLI